jgi:hypothetical protein
MERNAATYSHWNHAIGDPATQEVTVSVPCGSPEFNGVKVPVILDMTKHTNKAHPSCPYLVEFIVCEGEQINV